MEVQYPAACLALVVVLIYTWKLLNWAYLKPKSLEKFLRKQGLKGNSYKLVFGDLKEVVQTIENAKLKPNNLHDDTKPRVLFSYNIIQKYGMFLSNSFGGILFEYFAKCSLSFFFFFFFPTEF